MFQYKELFVQWKGPMNETVDANKEPASEMPPTHLHIVLISERTNLIKLC